ncbi:uncharacterized protein LOC110923204 [Helianthus annuus]|uniref:uncharacterized protein LOC110923204 n=1 Tax=Helianthus annuus TaxID=4232 RepID=UPI000B8F887F|nr:uncharacterized protein LOC110923204 [Helianthus annuus]
MVAVKLHRDGLCIGPTISPMFHSRVRVTVNGFRLDDGPGFDFEFKSTRSSSQPSQTNQHIGLTSQIWSTEDSARFSFAGPFWFGSRFGQQNSTTVNLSRLGQHPSQLGSTDSQLRSNSVNVRLGMS